MATSLPPMAINQGLATARKMAAKGQLEQARGVAKALFGAAQGHPELAAEALGHLGCIDLERGDLDEADQRLQTALQGGLDEDTRARFEGALAELWARLGDPGGQALLAQAFRRVRCPEQRAVLLCRAGSIAMLNGDPLVGMAALWDARAARRELGSAPELDWAVGGLEYTLNPSTEDTDSWVA
ncbi:MAG TPA: hypothetical protein QGF58_03325 [Myxococcota bacterium]|nr:hypothetical protein [Myxococcota bacterium]